MEDWTEPLLREYRKSKSMITKARARILRIKPEHLTDRETEELAMLNGIVSSMVFAIDWMRTGRQPGVYRGIDRRGVYQAPHVLDKDLFPSLQEDPPVQLFRLTPEQKEEALAAIRAMSPREFDCFLLHTVEGKSYSEIGRQLGISKRTVQQSVERAKGKIPECQTG
ncbi:sigma-70 family RNA polymerase sigma factor [Cohnella nanjingensis]|uniref:Sigma-70 family RNA polymerase sigma factor n=1 Tax=Cohnella nanjingensis TaxID=1387779 RepID=A0A7X0RML7_9BACL|nr:sigma-70 family RNA polymerase sigma factor [Cohnella nanjingensis]MBB6670262.1 sigma-70 family RNA polymerase sigma factor [Cohnella nanjingensis]